MTAALIARPAVLLGGWDLGDTRPGVAFGPFRAPPPVWRADLAADPVAAARAQDEAGRRIARADAAREDAIRRLSAFVADARRDAVTAPPGSPEDDLAATLRTLTAGGEPVAFGIPGDIADRWRGLVDAFRVSMERLERLLAGQVLVETSIAGEVASRSVVELDGDLVTVWRGTPEATLVSLHRRSLANALASRQTALRTLVTLLRGAALVATVPAILGTPAGFLLVVPAVWRFISGVIDAPGDP